MNPLQWLFGGPEAPMLKGSSPASQFPDPQEAQEAAQAGMHYGSPEFDGFISNSQLMMPPGPPTPKGPVRSIPSLVSPTAKPTPAEGAQEYLSALLLAANRNSIAALGADPRHLTVDPFSPTYMQQGTRNQILGQYDPNIDQMWTGTPNPSVAVHESFHRGLQTMRDLGYNTEAPIKQGGPQNEELLVRYLMSQLGNPERGTHTEVEQGRQMFEGKEARNFVQKLMSQAAYEVAKRRPRGPR